MQANEALIRSVVQQVLAEVRPAPPVIVSSQFTGRNGIFDDADQAASAAREAFEKLSELTIDDRTRIIDHIRRISIDQCVELGTMEMDETKIGRLEHKHEKLKTVGEKSLGTEFLKSEIYSGSRGQAVIEHAPFGVIGCITPVTHSLPTITCNAISMIAAGNTLVVNAHPSGRRVAAEGVRRFNQAIHADVGIDNLITMIAEPTLESADAIFNHRDVKLICVTGGPAVARAAMRSNKRAIVAGPGNPPVVVDETADLSRAAHSIILGGAYDNNLLCISEKEVFVVESVFEPMMDAMQRAGAMRLSAQQVDQLTRNAIIEIGEGSHRHDAPSPEFIGRDASVLARGAGASAPDSVELLYGETDEFNPFVPVEQMMPFIPFVRVRDVDEAIEKAHIYEHGFGHTAIIHSNNLRNITRMGQIMDTTLFVANGPCTASLGSDGEGYMSFSIATPTGEGVTTPLTFTRERRASVIDDLCVLGRPR